MPSPTPRFDGVEILSPFLEGLRPAEIDKILAAATQRHFRAHTIITRQGTPASRLYMLLHGRARYFVDTHKGQKVLLMWVVPGGMIGGGALTMKLLNPRDIGRTRHSRPCLRRDDNAGVCRPAPAAGAASASQDAARPCNSHCRCILRCGLRQCRRVVLKRTERRLRSQHHWQQHWSECQNYATGGQRSVTT